MSENPSSRWFWNDWDNDLGLRLCSLAAQGLWMRMLSIAARSDGYVSVDGRPCSDADLSSITGKPVAEVEELRSELEEKGVFSRDRKGAIYSRRMVRDKKRRTINQKNGKRGGNPTLRKQTTNSPLDKGGVGEAVAPLLPLVPIPKKEREEDSPPRTTSATPPVTGEGCTDDIPKSKRTRSNGSGRGMRLSPDWQPSDQSREFGEALGVDVDATADEFRDYWVALPGNKATKLDWERTFCNRCREVAARNTRQWTLANGANGDGRKTAATERNERNRQATLDACFRIEKRNRERAARDGTSDLRGT